MTRRSPWVGRIATTLLLSACGGGLKTIQIPDPTTISGPAVGVAPKHHLPPGVTVTELSLTPSEANGAVGQPIGFTATLKLSSGQTVYDPLLVRWTLGDPFAGSVDDKGVFTPTQPRSTTVRVEIGGRTAEAKVMISPAVYTWQQLHSPTVHDLYAASMISRNEAWVVGAKGTILRYFGGQWQPDFGQVRQDVTLRGIHFAESAAGWIVGHTGTEDKPTNPVAYSFINGQWTNLPLKASGSLRAVGAQDATHAWAVGGDTDGKVLIMRWTGRSFERDSSYQGRGHLNAIQMIGSGGWAVGQSGGDALLLHYDGHKWERQQGPFGPDFVESSELRGISMVNAEQGYAVGWVKPHVGFRKGLVLKYDSRGQNRFQLSNWQRMDAADGKTKYLDQVPLNGIAMFGGTHGWLLGATITPKVWVPLSPLNDVYGNLLSFDGTTYAVDNSYWKYNLSQEFLGVHLLPEGDGLIVGRKGYLMQRSYDWRQLGRYPVSQPGNTARVPGTTPEDPYFPE